MPRKLAYKVRENLEKCRSAAVAAVDAYNRPGSRFRTAQFVVLITIAWTALFHAIFFKRGQKPWYRKQQTRAVRYIWIDGDPKHWDLAECLVQFFGGNHPAERQNLRFLLGLRNKIEHRHLPQLDASLYGECQASLFNLEALLVQEFGSHFALSEQLAVSLQFSRTIPVEKKKVARKMAAREAKSVTDYAKKFRGDLPSLVLNSMKYSFNVFLVPRVVNRESAADAAVQFIHVDEASEEELERLSKLNVLIKEKHIPIANLNLLRPSHVVSMVCARRPHSGFTMGTHIRSWQKHRVRPKAGSKNPKQTKSKYCVFDTAHDDYLYTEAWVDFLVSEMDTNA